MRRAVILLVLAVLVPLTSTAAAPGLVFKAGDTTRLDLKQLVQELKTARIVTIGEQHNDRLHHEVQLAVIAALHEAEVPVAVGFEQFASDDQPGLDSWVAGKSDEQDLFSLYSANWDIDLYTLYRETFLYAREHDLQMVGLNVDRDIVSQVARQGFASLSAEQRGKIRVVSCDIDDQYKKVLASVLGYKERPAALFTRYCEAQVVWDTAMALNALDYVKANPDTVLVVLAGNFHAWKRGIPAQISRRSDLPVKTILPGGNTTFFDYDVMRKDADYVWWME